MSCEIEEATSFIADAKEHLNTGLEQLQASTDHATTALIMKNLNTLFQSIQLYINHLRQEIKQYQRNGLIRKALRSKINELENMHTLMFQQVMLKSVSS